VLKWVFERCEGTGRAVETPIGWMPAPDALDLPEGVTAADLRELLFVDREGWKREAASIHEHYGKFGDRLPAELWSQLEALEKRLR